MGDFWFLQGPEALHMYYLELADEPVGRFREVGIGHATSTDGVRWTEQGRIIGRGEPGAFDDAAMFTGSALQVRGRYFMLYTGLTDADRVQRIGVLTSDDLVSWRRFEGNPVLEPHPRWYETAADVGEDTWVAWRDPYLWFSDEEDACYAFITATERGEDSRHERGCIGLARSEDMTRWEALAPVAAPGLYHDHEVPGLLHVGEWWYLVYSTRLWRYSEAARARTSPRWHRNGTHYLVSRDPLGGWEVPAVDVVAASMAEAHYAARARRIGDDVLLYSRGPGRGELALPMRLDASPDGTLRAMYWEGLARYRGESLCEDTPRPLRGTWQTAPGTMIGDASGGPALAACEASARDLDLSATMVPGPSCRAGLSVSDAQGSLAAVLDCERQEAAIERTSSGETLASVPWEVVAVRPAHLRVLADGEVVSLYVDDEFAVSAFVEGRGDGRGGVAVTRGTAELRDITVFALDLS